SLALELDLAGEDEEALFVRVEVRRYHPTGLQFAHAEAGVDPRFGLGHHRPTGEANSRPGPGVVRDGEVGLRRPGYNVSRRCVQALAGSAGVAAAAAAASACALRRCASSSR